jgi:hypothetical protein
MSSKTNSPTSRKPLVFKSTYTNCDSSQNAAVLAQRRAHYIDARPHSYYYAGPESADQVDAAML